MARPEVGLEPHLVPGAGFLPQGVAAGAQAVADVVVHEARLDGVEVHQGHGLAGVGVHHDVVHLRVAVDHPGLELSLFFGVLQDRGQTPRAATNFEPYATSGEAGAVLPALTSS